MREIADKAYESMKQNIKKLNNVSMLYKDEVKEIRELYRKTDNLKNRMICLDEYKQQLAIFNLSVYINTQIEKLTA